MQKSYSKLVPVPFASLKRWSGVSDRSPLLISDMQNIAVCQSCPDTLCGKMASAKLPGHTLGLTPARAHTRKYL